MRHGDGDARGALKSRGYDVRGSDQNVYPPMSDFLGSRDHDPAGLSRRAHHRGHRPRRHRQCAISRGNPELEEVLDRKIRYCSLPEAVRDHFLWGARSIVIAGTHGKTTTTSLTGWLLAHGGADPNVFIGGIAENFESSYRIGGGREFVIEGTSTTARSSTRPPSSSSTCRTSRWSTTSSSITRTSTRTSKPSALAFQRFVNLVPRRGLLLLGADNAEALALASRAHCRVETFGMSDDADWQAHDLRRREPRRRSASAASGADRRLRAAAARRSTSATRSPRSPSARGRAQHRHAGRGAAPRSRACGAGWSCVAHGGGVSVYDDFAHHPTAIAETLAGVRTAFPNRRIWAIFEPRSATSCRRVFQSDFARALSAADMVVLPAVFRSTLPEDQRLSAEQLVADLKAAEVDARYIPQVDEIVRDRRRRRAARAIW